MHRRLRDRIKQVSGQVETVEHVLTLRTATTNPPKVTDKLTPLNRQVRCLSGDVHFIQIVPRIRRLITVIRDANLVIQRAVTVVRNTERCLIRLLRNFDVDRIRGQ